MSCELEPKEPARSEDRSIDSWLAVVVLASKSARVGRGINILVYREGWKQIWRSGRQFKIR